MDNTNPGISCAFYTVKQLAALFGKSEDTIRRWKNEGVGKEEDNIKLRAVEREDARGRKNARHLVFSRDAVIEFVKANPFLMDDAPQLSLMMQAEGAWTGGAIPMPGAVSTFTPPETDEDIEGLEDEFPKHFPRRGDGIVSVKADRDPTPERPQFVRQYLRRPWNSVLHDFENSDADDPVYHPKADPRSEDEPDPWARESSRSFFSGFTPFDEDEDEEEDEFEDEIPRPHSFDPTEAREEAGFGAPTPPRPRRRSAAENKKKREMLLYVSYVLSCHMGELEDELGDISTSLRELNRGGLGIRGTDTMRRMLTSRRDELSKKIDYLGEFLEILGEE